MKMRHALFALLLTSAAAFGQEPRTPIYDKLKVYLTLTDAQVTQLTTLQTSHGQSVQTLYTQISEQHRVIYEQLSSETPNGTAVANAAVAIGNLNRQIKTANEQHRTSALAVLTEAQRPKLQQLDAASKLGAEIGQASSLGLLEGFAGPFFPLARLAPGNFLSAAAQSGQ